MRGEPPAVRRETPAVRREAPASFRGGLPMPSFSGRPSQPRLEGPGLSYPRPFRSGLPGRPFFGETVIIWRTVLRNHFWGTGFGKPLWGNRFWEAVFGSVERVWSTAPKTSGSKKAVLSTRVKVILKGSETAYDLFNTCL